jgi:hypothetical protein
MSRTQVALAPFPHMWNWTGSGMLKSDTTLARLRYTLARIMSRGKMTVVLQQKPDANAMAMHEPVPCLGND